ncbi:MAG: biotin--[acetyl-CoA-carboxylase] ligase [Candidatus Eremiobacteraeota bacterium]|nr:biotin--[acetyl-CoA-carboxylase] ligase [Candidatus Eremiobacteraeota bacterium]
MESLAGTGFANVRWESRTGSTNDDVATLLGSSEAAGLTIVADYQEHGVGRKGRSWIAPPAASLLFTTALPNPIASREVWAVPFWTALAVQRALIDAGVPATLQWPNDLLLAGRKLAGILCVSRIVGAEAWVGCGVGINVHRVKDPALEQIVPPPAFCSDVAAISRETLLERILLVFAATQEQLRNPHNIARRWEAAAGLPDISYRVLVDGESEPLDVTAIRLANGGGLVVRTATNTERTINLADARAMR